MENGDKKVGDRLDGSNLVRECATLFANDYYRSFEPGIADLIKMSRQNKYRTKPVDHLGLQLGILKKLQELEEASSRGKRIAKEKNSRDIELQSRRNRYLSKALREIADGIAWRTLKYTRYKIRILSQGRASGHTWGKLLGQQAEIKRAVNAVGGGGLVIINDITNILRVGDLTGVRPGEDDVNLAEIKRKELVTAHSIAQKLKKGMKLDKQEKRLIQAQIALDTHIFPYGRHRIPIANIRPRTTNYVRQARSVIDEALKTGAAGGMLSPYMFFEAVDLDKLMASDDFEALLDAKNTLRPNQLTAGPEYSNYDKLMINYAGEAMRSSPPYTVFPLPPVIIAKIITGRLIIRATVYIEPLTRAFKKLGWDFSIDKEKLMKYQPLTDAQGVQYFSSEKLFPDDPSEEDSLDGWMNLSYPNGFNFDPQQLISMMPYELTSADYIVSYAEEVMAISKPGVVNITYPEPLTDKGRWQ